MAVASYEPSRAASETTRVSQQRPEPTSPVDLDLVIPALNEARRLPGTLERTVEYLGSQQYSARVIVVDNGSWDGTADVARSFGNRPHLPVDVVHCTRPGKGAAIRAGFSASTGRWLGFMDADHATPIESLDTVIPLLVNGHRVVIGSRRTVGARFAVPQSRARQLGGDAFRVAARGLVPGVDDTQCGFKFFDGDLARAHAGACRIDGFSFDVELLARLHRAGHEVVEVGVTWSDADGSTFSPLRHGLRSFGDTLRIHWLLAGSRDTYVPASWALRASAAVRPAT